MISPWMSIWSRPSSTIRSIVESRPNYGFWPLAALFGLCSTFFFANFYSFGLYPSFLPLAFLLVALSPVLSAAWLSFDAWVLTLLARLTGARAVYPEVRAVVAWSKVPYLFSLVFWLSYMAISWDTVFILYASETSAVLIFVIGVIVNLLSLLLLIQGVSEVLLVSWLRSLATVCLGWFVSCLILLISIYAMRYVYIILF